MASTVRAAGAPRRRPIYRDDVGWEQPTGRWYVRGPLFAALFVVLLGFVFAVLGVVGTFLESDQVRWSMGDYLRLHGEFVLSIAVVVTMAIFLWLLMRRDRSGQTTPRLLAFVVALGIFDAACLAIARF